MKAIRVHQPGEPDVMKLEEVPDLKPAAGQVLIRVKAVGVNPVETYIRSGKYPLTVPLPYTPGSDAAGTVEAVGPDVKSVRPGDRVYTAGSLSGTYAQLALCGETQVHRLPPEVSFQQGAAVNVPYATAWRAIHLRARAVPGEVILVHGASGGVGVAATQIAKALSAVVIGTGGTDRGRRLVQEQGADHVLDHHDPNYLQRLTDLTGGKGPDVIIELLANVNLNKDLGVVARYGRVVVIGSRGPVEIDARQAMGKDSSILGMSLANATPAELRTIHAALGAGLQNGTLRPVIGKELSLAERPSPPRGDGRRGVRKGRVDPVRGAATRQWRGVRTYAIQHATGTSPVPRSEPCHCPLPELIKLPFRAAAEGGQGERVTADSLSFPSTPRAPTPPGEGRSGATRPARSRSKLGNRA